MSIIQNQIEQNGLIGQTEFFYSGDEILFRFIEIIGSYKSLNN